VCDKSREGKQKDGDGKCGPVLFVVRMDDGSVFQMGAVLDRPIQFCLEGENETMGSLLQF